jgi:haloacetate dehalogenase
LTARRQTSARRRSSVATGDTADTWYERAGGPLGIWREWARDVTGRAIAGGHFFPEQNPHDTLAALRSFLGASSSDRA